MMTMTINDKYIIHNLLTHLLSCVAMLGIVILTSCSGDEVELTPTSELAPMSFSGDIATTTEGNTRAADDNGLENYATSFIVYGYKTVDGTRQEVFPGYTVQYTANSANTTTTNSCGWEYDGLHPSDGILQSAKYWDTSAEEYRVFGITSTSDPSSKPKTTTSGTETDVVFTLDATSDAKITATPYFSDLWYKAYADLPSCVNQPIQLTFMKPFCKVRLMFVDENGKQYTNRNALESPKFQPATSSDKLILKGTFTLKYPISKGSATTFSYVSTASTDPDVQATAEYLDEPYETGTLAFATSSEKWYTLFPIQSTGAFKMSATVNHVDKVVTIPASLVQWKPGYSYTYMFKITDATSDIRLINVIQVAIKNWSNGTTVNQTIYNW